VFKLNFSNGANQPKGLVLQGYLPNGHT